MIFLLQNLKNICKNHKEERNSMKRKRLTQIFPFLLPIRVWQRKLFYNIGMKFDKNTYSNKFGDLLKYEICNTKTSMINKNSGQDIIYQKNKVDNLKIASKTMNHIFAQKGKADTEIARNECFTFATDSGSD